MGSLPSFEKLIAALERLPGVGPKSARRLAHFLLSSPEAEAEGLVLALRDAREKTRSCSTCHALTEADPCVICTDPGRDGRLLAVVEEPGDVEVLEKTREFRGRYHVLGGALAPLKGVGPDDLFVADLLERVKGSGVAEVLLATNPNVEGEATALFLARKLKASGVKVTRLAFGLPVGAALEFADEVTLSRSVSGRREM